MFSCKASNPLLVPKLVRWSRFLQFKIYIIWRWSLHSRITYWSIKSILNFQPLLRTHYWSGCQNFSNLDFFLLLIYPCYKYWYFWCSGFSESNFKQHTTFTVLTTVIQIKRWRLSISKRCWLRFRGKQEIVGFFFDTQ